MTPLSERGLVPDTPSIKRGNSPRRVLKPIARGFVSLISSDMTLQMAKKQKRPLTVFIRRFSLLIFNFSKSFPLKPPVPCNVIIFMRDCYFSSFYCAIENESQQTTTQPASKSIFFLSNEPRSSSSFLRKRNTRFQLPQAQKER